MPNLKGKVAIVTGASRGIGRGIALELASCGADVMVNYVSSADKAEAVANEIRAMGRRALVYRADVSKRDQVQAMIDATVREFGRVDIMVPNAAHNVRKPVLELEPEDVAATWDMTLWATFHCSQLAARQMVKQGGGGKICVISSVHAEMPFKKCMSYASGKAGMHQMARVMANELAAHRINVNVLEPGWIDTEGERALPTAQVMLQTAAKIPLGRLGTVEENGKAVAFLCSDDASYITGTILLLDGGFKFPDWQQVIT
jgi:glucose 1-dehydrogenase